MKRKEQEDGRKLPAVTGEGKGSIKVGIGIEEVKRV